MTRQTHASNSIKPLKLLYISMLALMLAALAWLSHQPSASQPQLQRIKQAGVLRVVTRMGPTTYYEGAAGMAGLEYELAKRFADGLGVRLEIVVRDNYPEILDALKAGEADVAAAGLSIRHGWHDAVRFGPGYQDISQKLVYKQGRPLPRSLNQLNGSLRVLGHSNQADRLLQLKKDFPALRWTETTDSSSEELLEQVLSGELDYTVVDSHELDLIRRFNPELAVAFTLTEPTPLAWAFPANEDDSLYARAVDFFGALNADGELTHLTERYYGHLGQFDYVNTRAFLSKIEGTLPKYRPHFQEAAGADLDWRLLAAVGYQESMWDPLARSKTGVRGMMMLTEGTATEMGVTQRTDAKQSIHGGAQYLRQLLAKVPTEIAEPDRTWFALAGYNVGWGHLNDARQLTREAGGDDKKWAQVKERLPLLSKKRWFTRTRHGYARGYEPVHFVDSIRRYHETLTGLYDADGNPIQLSASTKAPTPTPPPVKAAVPDTAAVKPTAPAFNVAPLAKEATLKPAVTETVAAANVN